MKKNVANEIGQWALWAVKNKNGKYRFLYQQVRPFSVDLKKVNVLDCSAFATWCYRQAGAGDPNGVAYHYCGEGNTASLIQNGKRVTAPRPGDIAIFNVGKPVSTQHAAIVVAKGDDPLLVSQGQNGDPSLIHASDDPRPVTYYRYDTTQKWQPRSFPIA